MPLDLTVYQEPQDIQREILKILQGGDGAVSNPTEQTLITAQKSSYLEPVVSFAGGTVDGNPQQFTADLVEPIEGIGTPYVVVFHGTHTSPLRVETLDQSSFDIILPETRVTIGVFRAGDPKEFTRIRTADGSTSSNNLGYTVYVLRTPS